MLHAQLLGQLQPLSISVSAAKDHRPPLGQRHQRREQTHRSRPGNGDKIPGSHASLLDNRMHAAGQQLGQSTSFKPHAFGQLVDKRRIAVGRKAAVVPVAHDLALGAEVVVLAQAVVAVAADVHTRLASHAVAHLHVVADFRALFHHHATELVPHDDRRLDIVVDGIAVHV